MMSMALMMVSPVRVFDVSIIGTSGSAFIRPNNDGSLDYIPDGVVNKQVAQWNTFLKAGAPTIGSNYQVMMETISGTDWFGNLRDVWLSMGIFPNWGCSGNPSGPIVGRLHFRLGGSGQSIGSGQITMQVT